MGHPPSCCCCITASPARLLWGMSREKVQQFLTAVSSSSKGKRLQKLHHLLPGIGREVLFIFSGDKNRFGVNISSVLSQGRFFSIAVIFTTWWRDFYTWHWWVQVQTSTELLVLTGTTKSWGETGNACPVLGCYLWHPSFTLSAALEHTVT